MELEKLQFLIGDLLNKAAGYFKPGTRITFIARQPDNDEADFVLSSDDLKQAEYVLERRFQASLKEQGITEEDLYNDISYPGSIE